MYKLSRIFMMLTAVLSAFILLGSTLAAAASGFEMETAVSTSTWDSQFSASPSSYGVSLSPETAVSADEPGKTVTYTLQVQNTGSQTDTFTFTIEGSPNFLTQLSKNSVGPLAATVSETLIVSVTIPGSAGTEDSDTATIVAISQGDNDMQDSSQLTTNVAVPKTDLVVEKQASVPTAVINQTVAYTITVTNNGPFATTGVAVSDTLPAELTYSSHTASQGSYSAATGLWNLPPLAVNDTETLILTATVNTANATIVNTAVLASSTPGDSNPGNNSASATITVSALPILTIADTAVSENSPTATFTVTLFPAAPFPVSVNYASSDDTAQAGKDYTPAGGSLLFPPGQTTQFIQVPIQADGINEADEQFTMTLSTPSLATIGDAEARGVIRDDDPLIIDLVGNSSRLESSGAVPFTVTLNISSEQTIAVRYTTQNGSAIGGSDYQPTTAQLLFNPGQVLQTATVPLLNDLLNEVDESFSVQLSNPVGRGASIGKATATGIIEDDDDITISVGETAVVEGTAITNTARFSVTLSGSSQQTITVAYTTANLTALAGSDYSATSGVLVMPPGQTTQLVTVPIVGDSTVEADEQFKLIISNPTGRGVTIANNTGIATIQNDDGNGSITSYVWDDSYDNDGLQDSNELGIGSVEIQLWSWATIESSLVQTGTTSASGHYTFTNLAAGSYYLRFIPSNVRTFTEPDVYSPDQFDSDAHNSYYSADYGKTITFTVQNTSTLSHWDAGLIDRVDLTGSVWHDANGDGDFDANELPMSGLVIGQGLYRSVGAPPFELLIYTTTVDINGRYTIPNTIDPIYTPFTGSESAFYIPEPVGSNWFFASTPKLEEFPQSNRFYYEFNPGNTPLSSLDIGFYHPVTFTGHVYQDLDADGIYDQGVEPPIDDVQIVLKQNGKVVVYGGITDQAGNFTAHNIPPGSYSLQPNGSAWTASGVTTAVITSGQTITPYLGLKQGGLINGTGWFDINRDGIRDFSENKGVAGLIFKLYQVGSPTPIMTTTGSTDITGEYAFFDVPPGNYVVEASNRYGHTFSPQDQGTDDGYDSDFSPTTFRTNPISLATTSSSGHADVGVSWRDDILGVVWDDANVDGYHQSNEANLSNITVHLLQNNQIISTTKTGGVTDPYYRFENLLSGDYQIQVVLPTGKLFVTQPSYNSQGTNHSNVDPKTGKSIVVATYQTVRLSAGIYTPSATGNATPGGGGTVTAPHGQPLANLHQATTAVSPQISLVVPPNGVTMTTDLFLTIPVDYPTAVTNTYPFTAPTGLTAAGSLFHFDVKQNEAQLPDFTFERPLLATIIYDDNDMAGVDESTVRLFYWDWGNGLWLDEEGECETAVTPQLNTETNTFTTEICQTGRYALFGVPKTEFDIYLPVVIRP